MYEFILQEILDALTLPSHLLVMIGLGLLLGQQGWQCAKTGVAACLVGILVGLLLMRLGWSIEKIEWVLLGLTLVMGVLLAWKPVLPVWGVGLLAVGSGVLLGLDSVPSLIPGIQASTIYTILAGTAVAATLAVVVLTSLALVLRNWLNGMILRVLGSWVAASAIMVLTLQLAPAMKG